MRFRSFVQRRPRGARQAGRVGSVVLFALSALVACEWHGGGYPTGPDARSLVIHGMLSAGDERQTILVERTRAVHEGYYRGLTPAADAEVTVEGPEGTHRFVEDPEGSGVYRASFSPRVGERYALQVRGPGGETATSTTLIPAAPRLMFPEADTAVSLGSELALRWSSSPAAAGYLVLDAPPGQPSTLSALLHPAIVGDTAMTVQWGSFGRKEFHVRVAAVDSGYVRYSRGDGGRARGALSTISGGYGLFGSYAASGARRISVR